MGFPSVERIKRAFDLTQNLSREQVASKLGVDIETVSRYVREYKRCHVPGGGEHRKKPRANVLLFDIETLYGVGRYWNVWKTNINQWQIIKPSCMLSWSAKYLFDSEIIGDIMTSEEALNRDDKRITQNLWYLMENADIVIAHNGKAFDITKINTQFITHGFGPPSPYRVIDTCLVARKYFAFEHNTLDALAERLGIPGKTKTDNSLWVECDEGNPRSLGEMLEYNKNDVRVLEDVYVKLRPWIKDHPALSLFHDVSETDGKPMCRTCESTNMVVSGMYTTTVNAFDSLRCLDCGAIHRSRKSNTSLKRDTHVLQGTS